jgi:exo-beta-1,3-glucanase (GH17 family)
MKKVITLLILALVSLPANSLAGGFAEQFIAINYGPYHLKDSGTQQYQQPGNTIPPDQIKTDLGLIAAANFKYVKTFTVADGMDQVPLIAKTYYPNLKICLGVYEDGCNHAETQRQLDLAIASANSNDNVVAIIVGDECLPGDARAGSCPVLVATLCNDLKYVRERVKPAVIVTTDLSFGAAHDNFVQELKACPYIDVWMINTYPFYTPGGLPCEEKAIRDNLDWNYNEFNAQKYYGSTGKQILLGEHGWPTTGGDYGISHPSVPNQQLYFRVTSKWFQEKKWSAFYFEFFDEPWKSADNEPGGIGPHWGLSYSNGARKTIVSPSNFLLE